MKNNWLIVLILFQLACGGDDLDISNTPLQGLVDGKDWTYESANGFSQGGRFYRMRFLPTNQPGASDPCGVPVPSLPYLEVEMNPPRIISTSLPLISPEKVSFRYPNGKEFVATSGFLEITNQNNSIMRGLIQAEAAQDSVSGIFEVRFCN